MGYLGGLEKLNISAFRKNDFTQPDGEFSVMINPESYKRTYEICYNDVQPQGKSSGTPEFNKAPSDKVNFEIIFDGTGVVPSALPGVVPYTEDGIADKIEEFLNLVFTYDGSIHSPNFLELSWGTLIFRCRLTSLDINYTLFKPDGTPLRAKATAAFIEYTNPVQLAKEENNQSPDLSHLLTVKAGDTLPLMCYGIYGSSEYYIQVAEANGIADFRHLAVGSQILFPPLQGTTE